MGSTPNGSREALWKQSGRLAPEILLPEVANALWKFHRFEKPEAATCHRALELAVGLVDILVSHRALVREALSLSMAARTPAYDMFYLALVRREGAALLTLDAALRKEAVRQRDSEWHKRPGRRGDCAARRRGGEVPRDRI